MTQTNKFEILSLEGNVQRGGWQANVTAISDQSLVTYGRETRLLTKIEGGGATMPDFISALEGSQFPQSLQWDKSQSALNVTVATTDYFLKNAGIQGIYFSEQASPSNPHQMTDLRLGKIVYHILTEHTNCTKATAGGWVNIDRIDTIGSTSVDVYTVRQSNSIWSVLAKIAGNEFYVRYFTKRDEFVYEPHPQYRATLPDPVISIDSTYIIGQPTITYRTDVDTDQVQLYALTDTGVILTSNYPANVGTEGVKQKFTDIRCNEQIRADLLAERAYKFLNRDFNVSLTLPGSIGSYLELYDRVSLSYTGTSINGVTVDWTDKKFWVSSIRLVRQGNFGAVTELELDEENI